MNIQAQTYPRSPVLKRRSAAPPNRAERRKLIDRVELEAGGVQKGSRWVGRIGKFISKVPKFLGHTARFLGATLVGGLSAAIQLAAGSLGLVGMAGLGLAGALEMRDGYKEKDPLKMLSFIPLQEFGALIPASFRRGNFWIWANMREWLWPLQPSGRCKAAFISLVEH